MTLHVVCRYTSFTCVLVYSLNQIESNRIFSFFFLLPFFLKSGAPTFLNISQMRQAFTRAVRSGRNGRLVRLDRNCTTKAHKTWSSSSRKAIASAGINTSMCSKVPSCAAAVIMRVSCASMCFPRADNMESFHFYSTSRPQSRLGAAILHLFRTGRSCLSLGCKFVLTTEVAR